MNSNKHNIQFIYIRDSDNKEKHKKEPLPHKPRRRVEEDEGEWRNPQALTLLQANTCTNPCLNGTPRTLVTCRSSY